MRRRWFFNRDATTGYHFTLLCDYFFIMGRLLQVLSSINLGVYIELMGYKHRLLEHHWVFLTQFLLLKNLNRGWPLFYGITGGFSHSNLFYRVN